MKLTRCLLARAPRRTPGFAYPRVGSRVGSRAVSLAALLAIASSAPLAAQGDSFTLGKQAFLANDLESASSLLDVAVRTRPADPERRAWFADAARRRQDAATALREARHALTLDGCNSHAHEVLAQLFNPQFAHAVPASEDSTAAHLEAAVRCDATNGSAWMSLWVQSFRIADARAQSAAARRALDGLAESGMITPSWRAHARWVLATLPRRAIVLAAGDIDTYPLAMAIAEDGTRDDLALVNTSMLDIGYVVRHLARTYVLPMPPALGPALARSPSRDSAEFSAARIIAHWRAEAAAGRLQRPLVILHSHGYEFAADGPGAPRLMGPFWTITGGEESVDSAAVSRAYRTAESLDLTGPFLAENDRSPVRASNAFPPAIMLGYLVAYEAGARGGMREGRIAWMEREFARAGVSEADAAPILGWLRGFPPK